jgi:hypothetical protein
MRRVTIKEAASFLGVEEGAVKTQIRTGRLVACQDAEYRGYVWLREATQALPGRESTSKARIVKDRCETGRPGKADPHSTDTAMPASRQEARSKSEDRERRPRTSQHAQAVQLLQEVVAMLKEELKAKDRQLELKDAEIEARREEVRGLLAILHQGRALPSAAD